MGVPFEQRAQQPGSFLVDLGKLAPMLDHNTGKNNVRKKQVTSWDVTNSWVG